MVVDDEPMVRQALKLMLKHARCEAEAVEDGKAALDMLAQRKFDVVITDFSMPGMHGDQLVARIRQIYPMQPIIMATAFVEEYKVFGQPGGSVDALLLKPFAFKELTDAIDRVLNQEHPGEPAIPPQDDVQRRFKG